MFLQTLTKAALIRTCKGPTRGNDGIIKDFWGDFLPCPFMQTRFALSYDMIRAHIMKCKLNASANV
jgi:hypothetical protein